MDWQIIKFVILNALFAGVIIYGLYQVTKKQGAAENEQPDKNTANTILIVVAVIVSVMVLGKAFSYVKSMSNTPRSANNYDY